MGRGLGIRSLRLWAPLLTLLVPFLLLVGMGLRYVGLATVDRTELARERARLFMETAASELARQVQSQAAAALDLLAPAGMESEPEKLVAALRKDRAAQAESRPAVVGAFLIQGGLLLYPELTTPELLGHPEAEFPFERLNGRSQQETWERVSAVVDDLLRALSFSWALEEIQKAKETAGRRDPDLPAFLDYLRATVLRAADRREEARQAFRALGEDLSRRPARPGREVLLCAYEAARLAPGEEWHRELLKLAREIAGGLWNDVPERFLQFLFHEQIAVQLVTRAPAEAVDALEGAVRPQEQQREVRRAQAIALAFLGKPLVLAELERSRQDSPTDIYFLDMQGAGQDLLLAFRLLQADRPGPTIVGAALDLARMADECPALDPPPEEEAGPESLQLTLRTPRNLPVALGGAGSEAEGEPLAWRDLGLPLPGFRLVAHVVDPEAGRRQARADQLKLFLYLITLSLMAGAGVFFLLRQLRREMELARLEAEFVARVTHDLKTPLALIRLYAETLALGRAREQEQVERCGRVITAECDRLSRQVDRVLDFSRLEQGRSQYRPEPGSLAAEVEAVLESFAPEALHRQCRIEAAIAQTPPAVFDRDAFRQALLNLLDNAVKFGGDRIEVALEPHGGEAYLEVRDRGPGIPPRERQRIFQAFYRGAGAEGQRGTGLGLATVRHFAEAHRGSVAALPREGGGTIMRLVLPVGRKGAAGPEDGP